MPLRFTHLVLSLFFILVSASASRAQVPEVEPNNTLTTANQMPYAATIVGQVICAASDNDDYFRVVLPAGTKSLRIITKSKMQTGSGGSMYYYLYNKYGSQLASYFQSNLTTTWLIDTLDYPCFAGDTFFVRAYNWGGGCKDYEVTTGTPAVFQAGADPEVNDAFSTATPLAFNFDTSGHLANQRYGTAAALTDLNDYYRVIPPTGNKGLRLITRWRTATPGATGTAYVYLYNKFQQQLANNYVTGITNTWKSDTLNVPCFEGDTFYVRMYDWSGDCKEYRMRMTTPSVYTVSNDVENNDDFATAKPIPWATDSSGHLASQRYGTTTSYTDLNDYYRVIAPTGNRSLRLVTRWRMATPGGTGTAYVYLYNKFQQLLTNNYVTGISNTWKSDTLNYPCFEGDTFYVRMYDWSGNCKEYTYNAGSANSFLAGADPENNDNFSSATPLAFNTDTSGHLANQRYGATNSYTDLNDHYRVIAPAGNRSIRLITQWRVATPGATGSAYMYLYNKAQQQLAVKYINPINNAWKSDTLDYPCFEGDTFYVRMYDWSGNCKEYRVRTTTTGHFGFAGDVESNNTLGTATPLSFRTTTTGTLATQIYLPGSIATDANDYYRVVMPNNDRGIRAIINARTPTPGGNGAFYFYLYNKAGTQLASKFINATSTLKADTLEFPCFESDTFYVRIYEWSGDCKEYSLRAEYAANGPVSTAFENTRFGNDFSFVNRSRNATKYLWTFGDGATDSVKYPVHTYGIGQFIVKLKATGFCGFKEWRDTIQVEGVEYYSPMSAGSENGLGIFNLRFFGAGMDTLANVTLTKGGTVLRPMKRLSPSTKELTTFFRLTDVDTGFYDLAIQLSNGQNFSYPKGFEIFIEKPGVGVTAKITGPDRLRTGTMTSYNLVLKNDRARMANGVMAFIAVPAGVETNIHELLRKRTGVTRVQGSEYDRLTIDREFYNKVYYDGQFNPDADVIEMNHDLQYQAYDSMVRVRIDKLYDEPFDGWLYPLYIPFIPGNGTWTMAFKMKTPANGKYNIASFVWPFRLRQNPVSGETLDFIHDAGITAAVAAEASPVPALKAVGKAAGYIDIGSQVLFAEGVDWWYGTNTADEAFYARQGIALMGEVGGELLPTGGRLDDAYKNIDRAKDQITKRTRNLKFDLDNFAGSNPHFNGQARILIETLAKRLDESRGMLTKAQEEALYQATAHSLWKLGINISTKRIGDWVAPEDPEVPNPDAPEGIDRKPTNSVASLDPNAIYGNAGPGLHQYVRRGDALSYLVTFENVDTALAPAAVVRVELQLDTMKYDMRRTTLSHLSIAGKTYLVEDDRRDYFRDIDLRPAQNLIVRVNARMDSTGRAFWEFTSLDPATMDVPEDPAIGFLPPNVTKPEGEGSVSFTTYLKPGVANRDTFSAQARIFFDANEPIETNRWKNTVDEGLPATSLSPTITVTNDSVMHLSLAGGDPESGVERYALWMKTDTAWRAYPLYFRPNEPSLTVRGMPGLTYSFYVTAQDSVGNREGKPRVAEATITLPKREGPGAPVGDGLAVYPNPARGTVTVFVGTSDEGTLTLSITTPTGARAMDWSTEHQGGPTRYNVPLGSLAPGVYFVKAAIGSKMIGEARLVVVP